MSLRLRLIGLVCVVLLISLGLGGIIACSNAARSVRTEMRSALLVARQTIANTIGQLQNAPDPSQAITDLVVSFASNRHLRVQLIGEKSTVAGPAVEKPPFGDVPAWFAAVVGVAPERDRIPIVVGTRDFGTIMIGTDPRNETLEVWNEFTNSLVTPALFCGLTILLIYVFIGRTLRPLLLLAAALEEVGDGRYQTRLGGRLAPELASLRDSFNRMTARLAEADADNRRLHEQILTLQEQERRDLARDLHDEVSPFLFAINLDTATASRLLGEGRAIEACEHVQSIGEAARHMQRQVRNMLGRLRPIGLAEFGLREAIENIVAFWRRRLPEIHYQTTISPKCESLGELLDTTICRIVQEGLSNAMRHAGPTQIALSVDRDVQHDQEEVRVEIADNGGGMLEPQRPGYGLVGIKERVKAMGGRLTLSDRCGQGFVVTAIFPYPFAGREESVGVSQSGAER